MPQDSYLQIRGVLQENMVYRAQPGHETARPGRMPDGNPAFQLVLLDRNDHVLVCVAPEVRSNGCSNAGDPVQFRVRGTLPLHPEGTAYELRRGVVYLHRATIPEPTPAITKPACRSGDGSLAISWQRVPGENVTHSIVVEMGSGRRIVLARGLTETEYTVELSRLPVAGRGTVLISTNDGIRSTEVKATAIDVPVRPPTAHILNPAAAARVPTGQPVSVLGCCLDMAGRPCPPNPIIWLLDGQQFASGSQVTVIGSPAPGSHRLMLKYAADGEAECSVNFEVEEPNEHYRLWEQLTAASDHYPAIPNPSTQAIDYR